MGPYFAAHPQYLLSPEYLPQPGTNTMIVVYSKTATELVRFIVKDYSVRLDSLQQQIFIMQTLFKNRFSERLLANN